MANSFETQSVGALTEGSQYSANTDLLANSRLEAEFINTVTDTQQATWQEARMMRPPQVQTAPTPPALRPPLQEPSGPRVGPSMDSQPNVPNGPGFFERYRPLNNPHLGPAYYTNLPSPLNYVEPQHGGWFQLGDGRLVRGTDEVERIYQEQQKLIHGVEEAPTEKTVVEVDNQPDGQVPTAEQLKKRERERDATCHPNGGWELDPGYATRPKHTKDYETQITRAPGLDYVVRNPGQSPVKFDGCAVWDPQRQLLEAKGPGYEALHEKAGEYGFENSILEKDVAQMRRQGQAADGRAIEWHVAENGAIRHYGRVKETVSRDLSALRCGINVEVIYTPAQK